MGDWRFGRVEAGARSVLERTAEGEGRLVAAETVTVLFTDLVASTELLSRVGEERADEIRREHFGLLRAAIEATGGREVKNLGDGLMVAFDGVGAALSCAVSMQQAVTSRSPAAEPLAIRVGLSVGDAEAEDGDYFGLPVVEAARLCAVAGAGEILCAEMVRMLARSRGGFDLEPIGALDLKGLDEPVETYRVRWEPSAAADQPPLPSRLVAALSGAFVGRAAEQERLAAAWKAVVRGERRVVLLAGEPGIGKTTLTARLAEEAHDQGGVVLYGRCDEELGVPYQPWIESLGELVTHLPDDVLAAHVADRGPHLARLLPELARRTDVAAPAGGDGDAERFVVFGCVVDLLQRSARSRPVLLVLDDLHWADRPTTQLLRHLVGNLPDAPVGVVGTYRDSDVRAGDPTSELLAALHRERGVERLSLTGLTEVDLSGLLEQLGGRGLDHDGAALRDAVLAETAGNPFFVGEVLRHLAESGALVQDDTGRWRAGVDLLAEGLPVSVKEVVRRRVARLGTETDRLLTLASVIGRDFGIGLLAAVAGLDEASVIDSCDVAVAAAVLRETDEPDRYTFSHALIEHTLCDSLSAARRARTHQAIAEAIEAEVGADPGRRAGELAHHWTRAVAATGSAKAAHYAKLAGDRALAQSAPDEAVRWYGQALDIADRDTALESRRRVELLVGLGIAQRQTGVAAYRETLLEAAHLADKSNDVDLLLNAVLANSRGFFSSAGHVDDERLAVIDRALERLDATATSGRAKLLALSVAEHTYLSPLAERVALAEQAVGLAHASGEPTTCAAVLHLCMLPITHPSTLALRTTWLDEACDLVDRLDDPALAFWTHQWSMLAALERADGDALDDHAKQAEALADRVPDATIRWNSTMYRAWLAGVHGDPNAFETLAEAALNHGVESGQPDASTMYGGQVAGALNVQGRVHEIIPFIEQAIAESPGILAFPAALAVAKARRGDLDEVRTMLAEAVDVGFAMNEDVAWSIGMACWAEATALAGAADVAPTLRSILEPYHEQIVANGTSFLPSVAHHLGLLDHLLGDHDAADEWFREALDLHTNVRSPILVAQTQAAWASVLADRGRAGDHERARDLAQTALTAADAGGYGYVAADALAVLNDLG